MLWDLNRSTPDVNLFSDASGSWGCGAYWGSQWFHLQWPSSLQLLRIAIKELIPVVIRAAIYGRQWHGQLVDFTVDNRYATIWVNTVLHIAFECIAIYCHIAIFDIMSLN